MKKITLLITLLILVATSCRNVPMIGSNSHPFVVSEIYKINDKLSKYYAESWSSGYGNYLTNPSVILPSKMFNIGDTIKPENFISKYDTITFVK
jgi:hypothetical protein